LAATVIGIDSAQANRYPEGLGLKVVVAYPPGGSSDVVGRTAAERLASLWGVPVIVENVPGANGNIGNERVAKGPADGTQLLVVTTNIAINGYLYARLNYDPERDFVPVSQVARLSNLLLARKDLPIGSVADLIAYAKANPGKLNYASPGVGSSPHLAAEIFKRISGTDIVAVGYRGSAPALADLAAGNVDLMFDNVSSSIGLVRNGRVKALAVTSGQRASVLPDLPPVAETLPGYDISSFFGVCVRTGTPAAIVTRIEMALVAVAREQTVKERFAVVGAETVGSSSAEFARYLAAERNRWGKLITELGIRAE
jgi:tripartite-type tricarboxylate transporter receptor subunit TctC